MTAIDEKTDALEVVKYELALNLSKSILDQSLSTRDNLVKAISTLSVLSIPAYVGLVKIYSDSLASVGLWLKVAPVIAWALALSVCLFILFPKNEYFDFKNMAGIIQTHYDAVKRIRAYGIGAGIIQVLGLVVAACVFINST